MLCYKSIEISSPRALCGCDTGRCPWSKCMCCEGPPFNGGKPLNNYGICEHYCLTDALGFAFCGNGPNYKKGHDCRKCRPIDGIQFYFWFI